MLYAHSTFDYVCNMRIIFADKMTMAKTAKVTHILDIFSAQDDPTELIYFVLCHTSQDPLPPKLIILVIFRCYTRYQTQTFMMPGSLKV